MKKSNVSKDNLLVHSRIYYKGKVYEPDERSTTSGARMIAIVALVILASLAWGVISLVVALR
jgi:hypothetical protein